VRTPARILIADDNPDNVEIFRTRLASQGYEIIVAVEGEAALSLVREQTPDLLLLDVMMPKMDGIDVCRHVKADPSLPFMPIIMLTAKASTQDVVTALDAGADEYLTKPVDHGALVARVKSMLRIKALNDTVQEQSKKLAEWNTTLEKRVAEQLHQVENLSRLRRFFSPQLAEAILNGGAGDPLATHRREIVVVFLDLRGFTAFAETSEPEEVMRVLREFHAEMGKLILEYEGTLERFTGDGIMVFLNDPVVVPNPAQRALHMALAMHERVSELRISWLKHGYELSLGIGMAQGFATIGAIGYEGRIDYAALGTVTNLAARLCGEAKDGQVLTNRKTLSEFEHLVDFEPLGDLNLKGFVKPIAAFNIKSLSVPLPLAAQ
jgi:adenylate cyclase